MIPFPTTAVDRDRGYDGPEPGGFGAVVLCDCAQTPVLHKHLTKPKSHSWSQPEVSVAIRMEQWRTDVVLASEWEILAWREQMH